MNGNWRYRERTVERNCRFLSFPRSVGFEKFVFFEDPFKRLKARVSSSLVILLQFFPGHCQACLWGAMIKSKSKCVEVTSTSRKTVQSKCIGKPFLCFSFRN